MKRGIETFICLILLLYSSVSQAQRMQIKGTVVDEKGPLPGVNVLVKASKTGTQTDAKGNFSLQAAQDDTLVFSSVGYTLQEVKITGSTPLQIVMVSEAKALEEVVVIGYGTKKKENLTGAVSTVGSEVLQSRPITSTLQALQGEIPGTFIQRYSGQPGSEDYSLNVRGASSVSAADGTIPSPLVLIDGLEGNLNLLNPADIESISVLKDAQASIYGARAAGGVFLVTTKKGRGGAAKITYNNNFAVTEMTGMMKSPTNYEFAIMENEANLHAGAAPMYTPDLLERITGKWISAKA